MNSLRAEYELTAQKIIKAVIGLYSGGGNGSQQFYSETVISLLETSEKSTINVILRSLPARLRVETLRCVNTKPRLRFGEGRSRSPAVRDAVQRDNFSDVSGIY